VAQVDLGVGRKAAPDLGVGTTEDHHLVVGDGRDLRAMVLPPSRILHLRHP
jgi:hypothetical protein